VAVLPGDPDEKLCVVRFELLRRQKKLQRPRWARTIVEGIALRDQGRSRFGTRRTANQSEHGHQQEATKPTNSIHE